MRRYNQQFNSRNFIEHEIIKFLENNKIPQTIESIVDHLRQERVTIDIDGIRKIISFLEQSKKLVVSPKYKKCRLMINPEWEEIAARKERAEIRRYLNKELAL